MRRPCFEKAMVLAAGQKGLSELLAGAGTLEECLLQVDGTDLHVIAAGHIPRNPQELLLSRKFSDLLTAMRVRYDMIIIDSPPVQLVSDALVIGAQSTGLIFIVKADNTPVPLAKRALQRIASANIPIFGVVLNQREARRRRGITVSTQGTGSTGMSGVRGEALAVHLKSDPMHQLELPRLRGPVSAWVSSGFGDVTECSPVGDCHSA